LGVDHADVRGTWSGALSGSQTKSTDAKGRAVFAKRLLSGHAAATFCVDSIVHSRLRYDPTKNNETCRTFSSDSGGDLATLRSSDPKVEDALELSLVGSHPNPFRVETEIAFHLGRIAPVRLTIYNAAGQKVRALLNRPMSAGTHRVAWDGRDDSGRRVSAGVYLYRFEADSTRTTRKLTLLR
jgi:hypothetical protein